MTINSGKVLYGIIENSGNFFPNLCRNPVLIKPFFYMTKKKQSFKYLENEKSFQSEMKSIFRHF